MTVETLGGLPVLTATVIVASVVLLWLVSLLLRNVSIIDLFWGVGFVLIAWVTWGEGPHKDLITRSSPL